VAAGRLQVANRQEPLFNRIPDFAWPSRGPRRYARRLSLRIAGDDQVREGWEWFCDMAPHGPRSGPIPAELDSE